MASLNDGASEKHARDAAKHSVQEIITLRGPNIPMSRPVIAVPTATLTRPVEMMRETSARLQPVETVIGMIITDVPTIKIGITLTDRPTTQETNVHTAACFIDYVIAGR